LLKLRDHLEFGQIGLTKGRTDGHVRSIPASRNENAADTWLIMTRVQRPPAPTQINLEPSAEIHRREIGLHANITKIPRAVPGRDVHATTERDREMCEVPTNSRTIFMSFERRAVTPRTLIVE